jgi:tripartite ATP-independent transporter DctM subunit
VVLTFFLVLFGMYQGWFSATEAAAVGAALVGLHGALFGRMRWLQFREALVETGRTTAMIFLILIGAEIYNSFLALTQLPTELADTIQGLGWSPHAIIVLILLIYLVLGCIMDSLSMILLTVPVFFPLVVHLGFDPVWFGVLVVVVVEIGLISPPVGMNLFVLNALLPQVPTSTLFRGVLPFFVADVIRLGILIAFPAISLWLPSMMK